MVGIAPASSSEVMIPGKFYPRSEIKSGNISDMLEKPGLIEEIITVTDEEAVKMTYWLWKEKELYVGVSSGANVYDAVREAQKLGMGTTIVTVFPDNMNSI